MNARPNTRTVPVFPTSTNFSRTAARELGRLAHARGLDCAPACDANFKREDLTLVNMKAWIAGWTAAMIVAPLV